MKIWISSFYHQNVTFSKRALDCKDATSCRIYTVFQQIKLPDFMHCIVSFQPIKAIQKFLKIATSYTKQKDICIDDNTLIIPNIC